MPESVPVPDAPRRLSRRSAWLPAAGASPRGLLRRLLLGSDGTVVCGWGDERSLDRAPGAACPSGESYSVRPEGRTRRRRCLFRCGCLDVVFFTAVTSRLLFHVKCMITTWRSSASRHVGSHVRLNVRKWQCAPKARITCGGRIHPKNCRLILVA